MERRRQVSSRQEAEGPGPGSPEFYSVSRKLVLPAIPLGGLLPRAFSAPSLCLGCAPSVAPRPPAAARRSSLLACRQTLHRLRLEHELGLASRQGPANQF